MRLAVCASILISATAGSPARAQNSPPPAPAKAPAQPNSTVAPPVPAKAGATAVAKPADDKKEPVYHLLGFSLRGTKRVDTDALVGALPQHEGDVITTAQIKQDAQIIGAALKAHHVHGNMTTGILEREGPGHHIWVMWDLHPIDAIAMTPRNLTRFLDSQSFSGNAKLSTEALVTATGLHPGQRMPDGSVDEARTGIEQAYDKALHGAPVKVNGKVLFKPDHTIIINWMITEPK